MLRFLGCTFIMMILTLITCGLIFGFSATLTTIGNFFVWIGSLV